MTAPRLPALNRLYDPRLRRTAIIVVMNIADRTGGTTTSEGPPLALYVYTDAYCIIICTCFSAPLLKTHVFVRGKSWTFSMEANFVRIFEKQRRLRCPPARGFRNHKILGLFGGINFCVSELQGFVSLFQSVRL